MKKNKSFKNLTRSAEDNLKKNNLNGALNNLFDALKIEPKNYRLLNEIGNIFTIQHNYSLALQYHSEAAKYNDNEAKILCNIGLDLLKLDRVKESIEFFNFAIQADSNFLTAYSGLTTAYHGVGDIDNLYNISIKAITLFPSNYEFHLNLGISLIYLEKYNEALYSLETAEILNPTSIEAKVNKAALFSRIGRNNQSAEIYENLIDELLITKSPLINSVFFNLSFEYLYLGKLEKGWELYEYGFEKSIPFNQRRKPYREFHVPKWQGEKIKDKTLLIWREQGLGDEILFLSIIPDLINLAKKIIVECDIRLIDIIRRSFPEVAVREATNLDHADFDLHIPIASLCRFFRKNIDDFNNLKPYLLPDKEKVTEIIEARKIHHNKIFIGICWRSGLLNLQRNNNYIPLINWDEILRLPNAIFVSLQYGDCENEILEAELKYGIKILRWSRIDMKNDLESVFSIIANLDVVISAATAVSSMSYSTGKLTLVFQPKRNWTNLGTNYYPWSKFMKQFTPSEGNGIESTLSEISKYLMDINPKLINN